MRYRLHRSLVFWLGLFGLIFLGWAAVDSGHYNSRWIFCRNGIETWNMHNGSHRVVLARVRMITTDPHGIHSYAPTPLAGRWERYSLRRDISPPKFPFWSSSVDSYPGHQLLIHRLVFPYWLLIPLYLLSWVGLLGLRWTQAKRSVPSIASDESQEGG